MNEPPPIYEGDVPDPDKLDRPVVLPPQNKMQMPTWKEVVTNDDLIF